MVIPHPDQHLTEQERLRWRFTELAGQLVQAGVAVDVVVADARQGAEHGARLGAGDEAGRPAVQSGRGGPDANGATNDRPGAHRRTEGET